MFAYKMKFVAIIDESYACACMSRDLTIMIEGCQTIISALESRLPYSLLQFITFVNNIIVADQLF